MQHEKTLQDQRLQEKTTQLKNAEEKCQSLYQELMNSNAKGMDRWQEQQKKYEESQGIITKQLQVIDELNQKLSELKDVNNQIEYTWGQKYQEDQAKKDAEMRQLKQEFAEKEQKITLEHKSAIADLKTQFRNDFLVVDKELTRQTNACKEA